MEIIPWIIAGIWAIQLSFVIAGMRHRQVLRPSGSVNMAGLPKLSVLVAARNEEGCIEACIQSLNRQDYPNFEIIAIDDRSTDGTSGILNRLQMELQGRLRVIRVNSLPAGWLGKAHAMHVGMQFAQGDWICFTDADCEQTSNRTLSLAVHEAWKRGVEMLTLTPQFTANSVWEKITVPVCSFLMMIWFQPRQVNDPRSRTSYANGAFILMSRRCYDFVGGWTSVRTRLCEDVSLAHAVKASGMKLVMLQNEGLYRARMYDSIRDSWNGWSRIFYGCLSKSAIIISIVRLIAISVIPTWCCLLIAGHCLLTPGPGSAVWSTALAGWATVVVFQQIQAAIAFRLIGVPFRWSLAIHFGHLIMVGMLFRALFNQLGFGSLQWRGTVFHQGRIVPPIPALQTMKLQSRTSRKMALVDQTRFAPGVEQFVNGLNDAS